MKEIPNNNIDTPVFKKDQLKNGTFTMVNKVREKKKILLLSFVNIYIFVLYFLNECVYIFRL